MFDLIFAEFYVRVRIILIYLFPKHSLHFVHQPGFLRYLGLRGLQLHVCRLPRPGYLLDDCGAGEGTGGHLLTLIPLIAVIQRTK